MAYITIVANPSEPRTVEEVENVLRHLQGIREWALENGVLTLTYDDAATTIETLTDALMPIGYSAKFPTDIQN
jgi:hypothetical protein